MTIDRPSGYVSENNQTASRSGITQKMSPTATQLRKLLDRHIQRVTQSLFENIDDALFDMAESASNNQQQNHFFESMREVRIKRVDIEKNFTQSLVDDFTALFDKSVPKDKLGADNSLERGSSNDSLSLMENDAVEEMVAVNTMVARYEKLMTAELAALDVRLAKLAGREVDDSVACSFHNPFSPRRWSDHFLSATRMLSIDIKARIVIFKLFEKTVLGELPQLCKSANETLIRDGFLPNFRYGDRTSRSAGRSATGHSSDVRQHQSQQMGASPQPAMATGIAEFFGSVPQVPGALNTFWNDIVEGSPLSSSVLPVGLSNAIGGLSSMQGPMLSQPGLIEILNSMQQHQSTSSILSDECGVSSTSVQEPQNVLIALSQVLADVSQGSARSLGHRERELITLVSLLFQFVLDDRGVAAPMRVVISRLQIPVIKVALQDDEFFSQGFHPARRLVNELIQATIGWTESDDYHKDPLFRSVCGIVDRVLAEYENDPGIFSELLADLQSTLTGEEKRSTLREKRLVDAEVGKDTSEEARNFVSSLLSAYPLANAPEFVVKMVNEAWSNRLFLLYLQHGQDSEEWKDAVQTLTFILWSVDAARSSKDRRKILSQLPSQLKKVRQSFDAVSWPKHDCNFFFESLEALHLEIIQRDEVADGPDVKSDEQPDPVQPQLAEVHTLRPTDEMGAQVLVPESCGVASYEQVNAEPIEPDVDAKYIEAAEQLVVGQWIELHQQNKKKRCRLVAVLRNNGKRIFVDRKGVKACEFVVVDLAKCLESGEIVLLEDAHLFDKAMTSIISGLRKQKNLAASA